MVWFVINRMMEPLAYCFIRNSAIDNRWMGNAAYCSVKVYERRLAREMYPDVIFSVLRRGAKYRNIAFRVLLRRISNADEYLRRMSLATLKVGTADCILATDPGYLTRHSYTPEIDLPIYIDVIRKNLQFDVERVHSLDPRPFSETPGWGSVALFMTIGCPRILKFTIKIANSKSWICHIRNCELTSLAVKSIADYHRRLL